MTGGTMGLRERKKEQSRRGILAAAHELFLRQEYDETTMEQIAEEANVAVGTVYNYFTSKGVLLLSLIEDSDQKYIQEGNALVADPPADTQEALTTIMVLATEHCVRQLGKSIWRHVLAATMTSAGSAFSHQYEVTTSRHETLVVDMMAALQRRGDIDRRIDPADAAHFLFSMKSKLFMNFVCEDGMSLENHRAEVRRSVWYFLTTICAAPQSFARPPAAPA